MLGAAISICIVQAANIDVLLSAVIGVASGLTASRAAHCKGMVCPEQQLLVLLTGRWKPRTAPRKPLAKPHREEAVMLRVSPAEPVKIHGYALDPVSGSPMAGATLLLYVDGQEMERTIAAPDGSYTFFVELSPGSHEVEVRAGDALVLRKRVIVELRE